MQAIQTPGCYTVRVRIVSITRPQPSVFSFLVTVQAFERNGQWLSTQTKAKISWLSTAQKNPGLVFKENQLWQWTVRLKKARGLANPKGFDYEQWLFKQGVAFTGYLLDKPQARLLKQSNTMRSYFEKIHDRVYQEKPETGAVIKALTLGLRQDLSQKQWRIFRETGTAHLIAISGLHVGMVASTVGWFVFHLSHRITTTLLFSGLFSFFYAHLAGWSIPTQRAFIMLTVGLLTRAGSLSFSAWQALSLALITVLSLNPGAFDDIGFYLSFAAVALLIYTFQNRYHPAQSRYFAFLAFLKGPYVMFLGLMPLNLWFFNAQPLVSPLANLLAIPWVSFFVLPSALLGLITHFLSNWLAYLCLQCSGWLFDMLYQSLLFLHRHLGFVWHHGFPSRLNFLISLGLTLIVLSPKCWPGKYQATTLLVLTLTLRPNSLHQGDLSLLVFDVGQGLAALIKTQSHTLIYDTGPRWTSDQTASSSVILPYLWANRIRSLDRLIISHGDLDHSGGYLDLLSALTVHTVLSSEKKLIQRSQDRLCHQGQSWVWDGIGFKILHPRPDAWAYQKKKKTNHFSCVLSITVKGFRLILPGDIDAWAEQELARHFPIHQGQTILISPHHGSKTSSSEIFLEAAKPSLILISSGYKNRFNFPHDSVLKRYENRGIPWLNTAECGAIQIDIKNGKLQSIRTERFNCRSQ